MSKKDNSILAGIVIGSAVGTAVGLLFASRQGKETRAIVKKSLNALPELAADFSSTTQKRTQNWSNQAYQKWGRVRSRLQVAIAAGVEAASREKAADKSQFSQDSQQNN